jgi:hypothetical protein
MIKQIIMTQKETLYRGIKYLFGSLPLMFAGPSVIHSSLKNQENEYFYLVLAIGILLCLAAVFLMYKGLNIIMNSIFDK